MAKIVIFYNAKGGQGKTTLSILYALHSRSHYYTNDYKSGTEALYKDVFLKNHFHIIKENDLWFELPEDEDSDKLVFDFGGFIDKKIPKIVNNADLCVIPTTYESKADLYSLTTVLSSLANYTDKFLIVLNKTKTKDAAAVENFLTEIYQDKYPIKIVRPSAYMTYLANEGKTPFELQGIGAARNALTIIQNQLTDLFSTIMEYKKWAEK